MAKKSRSVYDSFGYEQINGNWYYGKTEYDASSKSYEFVKYGRYIAIERVSIDMDGGSPILTIVYETLDGETKSICVEKSLLSKKRELQSLLLQCDADAHDGGMKALLHCLHNSEESALRGRCFHRTGWLPGEKLAFKGRALIDGTPSGASVEYAGSYDLAMKGTFAAWKDMVEQAVLGNAPLELAILVGLSPIISSRWGARNLIVHFMGDSGTGKTTSAILALSTVGCPNPAETAKNVGVDGKPLRTLMSSWKGTSNALIGKLDGLDGTLMVFDELSKIEDDRVLTSTIYALSDGTDKDRMASPTELQTTNQIRTNILSLGEESLLERAKSKNSGINVRVSLYDVERFAEKLDLVNTKTYQFEEMKNHAMAKYRYERFMRLITKLIPESRCWSFEEWADENRIVDSLKLTMGIDFRNNWQQFDDVMRLLVWSENPSGYDRGVLSIRDVPFSVVKVIWPDNTEARIEELFMTACLDMRRHLQYEFTYANCVADNAYYLERQFIESWLYKQIKAWSHGDGYRLNHEIKKFLFDFEMGI